MYAHVGTRTIATKKLHPVSVDTHSLSLATAIKKEQILNRTKVIKEF